MERPPSPDPQWVPHPHISSPFQKLGIPIHPLMGLISTTSVLGSHPALTNTARNKRELICCASVISLLAACLEYALFCAVERHRKLTQQKKDRRPVRLDGLSVIRCRASADKMDTRTFPPVLTSSPCSPVPRNGQQTDFI